MRWSTPIGLLCVLTLGGLPALATDYDDSPEAWETYLDLLVIDRILEAYSETGDPEPVSGEDWITLRQFTKELPERFVDRLPMRDGWGREYLVGAVEEDRVILSRGANGMANLADGIRLAEENADAIRSVSDLFGDDIASSLGKVVNGPRTLHSRQRQTMADLRSVGTAVESYSIDNYFYPLQMDGLKGLETVEEALEPVYIRILPMLDAWDNPFLYWSDETQYVIVSPGADGILDPVWDDGAGALREIEFAGECDHENADIVFANGQFAQWPRDPRR